MYGDQTEKNVCKSCCVVWPVSTRKLAVILVVARKLAEFSVATCKLAEILVVARKLAEYSV